MTQNITTIKLGSVAGNCYLIKTAIGFILIVTGEKTNHKELEKELSQLACTSDNLNLIIFTHNKSFNYSNYEYLREKYKTKIAMHILDEALINDSESKSIGSVIANIFRKVFSIDNKSVEFKPDFIIDEGYNLSLYGLNARVLYLPGHSNTIGILTENGELFCDDLILEDNTQQNAINDNLKYLIKLKSFLVDMIYPAQGEPFALHSLNV